MGQHKQETMRPCTSRCARANGICDQYDGCPRGSEVKEVKYYFISGMCKYQHCDNFRPQTIAIKGEHPFSYIHSVNQTVKNCDTVLLSWQEITKEEYDLYQQLGLL